MSQAKTTFFRQQDQAKDATFKLLFLFAGGVMGTNFLVYVALRFLISAFVDETELGIFGPTPYTLSGILHDWVFRVTFTVTAGIILIGSLYETLTLLMNDDKILGFMNAKPVDPSTTDPKERQLRNVVEEMAIAAGLPVPRVFLMPDESGINAFAAGKDLNRAAIAVTRGCLEQLSRDELQAVIGHEFSHILNGDVKLNIKLMGWINGLFILVLIGKELAARSNSRGGTRIDAVGIVLIIVGGIGHFFGKLIKAMISREREFLADASSVQFTRNPQALYDALRKVGDGSGSKLNNHRSEQVDHMLLLPSAGFSYINWLASHPPLEARLQALKAVGANSSIQKKPIAPTNPLPTRPKDTPPPFRPEPKPAAFATGAVAVAYASKIGTVQPENLSQAHSRLSMLPPEVEEMKGTAAGAEALIATLLCPGTPLDERAFRPEVKALLPRAKGALNQANTSLTSRQIILNLALPALDILPKEEKEPVFQRLRLIALSGKDGFPSFDTFILLTLIRTKLFGLKGLRSRVTDSDLRIFLSLAASQAGDLQRSSDAFRVGAKTLGKSSLSLIHASAFRLDAVWDSIDRMRSAPSANRELLIHALESAIFADRQVTEHEGQLMRMLCLILGCPVPLTLES